MRRFFIQKNKRLATALLLTILLEPGVLGSAEKQKSKEADLGERFAHALMASAEAYAASGSRSWVDCGDDIDDVEEGKVGSLKSICAAEASLNNLVSEIEELKDSWNGKGPEYLRTVEATCFRILIEEGLKFKHPIARFQVLGRLFDLCDEPQFLTPEGKEHCGSEVEEACLRTLDSDPDGLNRQVALEILAMGYATKASEEKLLKIAKHANPTNGSCRLVFDKGSHGSKASSPDLDAIAKEYGDGHSSCEALLARQALDLLKNSNN